MTRIISVAMKKHARFKVQDNPLQPFTMFLIIYPTNRRAFYFVLLHYKTVVNKLIRKIMKAIQKEQTQYDIAVSNRVART